MQYFYDELTISPSLLQRPTARELIRHPYVKKAKRNNHLMDLIDRHRKWKLTHGQESDSDSGENSDGGNVDDADSDWDIGTIKEPISPYIEENGGSVSAAEQQQPAVLQQNGESSKARSPVKSAIDRSHQQQQQLQQQSRHSPNKEAAPPLSDSAGLRDNRAVAKSEANIVSSTELHLSPFTPSIDTHYIRVTYSFTTGDETLKSEVK